LLLVGSIIESLVSALRAAPSATHLELGRGDALIKQGDESDAVYLLVSGSLEVARALEGTKAVIAIVDEPGSIVGEMVSMGGGRRTASVTAIEPSELIEVDVSDFERLLEERKDLADLLVRVAIQRAEEGELAEILADHFGMVDEETLIATCQTVKWHRLAADDLLFSEGDPSDSVYFVVRGRLITSRNDPLEGEVKVGELGRGDVVGEIGVLERSPRSGTVIASRDTVVAEMPEEVFLGLIETQPRLMTGLFLDALARSKSPRWHSAPAKSVGVLVDPQLDARELVKRLVEELSIFGDTGRLSRSLLEGSLDHLGIADCEPGSLEEVRLARYVHELELASDFVVVETGDSPDRWARRGLGLVDQLLICVSPAISEADVRRLTEVARLAGEETARTLVVVRSDDSTPTGTGALRQALGASRVVQVRAHERDDVARLGRLAVGRASALVMSGGGGRGFAHIGVYRALRELGIPIDLVAGTSMGGVLGTAIADRASPDEVLGWAEDRFPNTLDYTLPLISLVKGERITSYARERFGDRDIEDLRLSYFAVSTDLTRSRPHIHDSGSIVLAIRATSAIPGVMPPVPHGDSLLVDGGVLNNLPIDVARSQAPLGKLIASDVAPPVGPGAHGDYGLSPSGWEALLSRWRRGRSPYPRISAVLMRSMITASMRERDAQVSDGLADCYLDLDMRGVSMLEFDSPKEVAGRGYEAAMPVLEAWLSSVGSEPIDDGTSTYSPSDERSLYPG
jgi:predicted acylesterase/phospholipase RssA/CRP-like cAMP-binding protein